MQSLLHGRAAARQAGHTKYLSTKPCKHGNIAPRWVANHKCTCDVCSGAKREFMKDYMRAYRAAKKGGAE